MRSERYLTHDGLAKRSRVSLRQPQDVAVAFALTLQREAGQPEQPERQGNRRTGARAAAARGHNRRDNQQLGPSPTVPPLILRQPQDRVAVTLAGPREALRRGERLRRLRWARLGGLARSEGRRRHLANENTN
jgi:hypothetical protein